MFLGKEGAGVDGPDVRPRGAFAWLSPLPIKGPRLPRQELIVPRSLEKDFKSADSSFARPNTLGWSLQLSGFTV